MTGPCDEPWCCLTCFSKFRFGELRTLPKSGLVHCPVCSSAYVHPAGKEQRELAEYHGDRGTLQ